jgi:hypothetical protein
MTESDLIDGHVGGIALRLQLIANQDAKANSAEPLSCGIRPLRLITCTRYVSVDLPRFDPKDFPEKPVNVCLLPTQGIKQSGSFKALLDLLARGLHVGFALAFADD